MTSTMSMPARSVARVAAQIAMCAASVVLVAACATQAPPPAPQAQAPAPAPARPASDPLPPAHVPQPIAIARPQFVRDTAARFGIDPAHIERVLAGAQVRESIVNAMARPAEAKPWRDYRPIFMTRARIDGGRAFLARHRDALSRVEARTGVPAELIVAIIGVETNYGANTGSFNVVDALYTLAFAYPRTGDPAKAERENRREAFFRDELAQLFALEKEAGLPIATLTGSYAGAMGWGQFMPSSYRQYAVDGDGDGRRDLFNSTDDVFASIANYFLGRGGWKPGGPVVVRANLDGANAPFEPTSLEAVHTLEALAARGYRPLSAVPTGATAVPINLDGANGPEHWLGFNNFYAITRYNISKHYAMAVHQLSEAIAGRGDA